MSKFTDMIINDTIENCVRLSGATSLYLCAIQGILGKSHKIVSEASSLL